MQKRGAKRAAYAGAFVFALMVCILYYSYRTNQLAATIDLSAQPFQTQAEARAQISYLVQVSGEVANPGVFDVPPGTRVYELLDMAGGLTEESDIDRINVVGFVRDGQRVDIPRYTRTIEPIDILAEHPETININTDDPYELMRLPGIGSQTAVNIVAHRRQHGDFQTTQQLMNVHGIGQGVFGRISQFITAD